MAMSSMVGEVRGARTKEIVAQLSACLSPSCAYIGCNEVLRVVGGVPEARLCELGSLPLGSVGHRIVALRYFIANGDAWLAHYAWAEPLASADAGAPNRVRAIHERIGRAREAVEQTLSELDALPLADLALRIEQQLEHDGDLGALVALRERPSWAARVRARLSDEAAALSGENARARDVLYLATYDLTTLPATTVSEGDLAYVIVADKGEMGVRAVREAIAYGAVPVVLFNATDDAGALQVRIAEAAGGFGVALEGTFRESYANPTRIAERVRAELVRRFGERAEATLARSALYPGYGPLAESTAAIQCFRRAGIVFVGPSQDSVERAGDKRRFRALAEAIDPAKVTPGVVIDSSDAGVIEQVVREAHAKGTFTFPGRLKAANGGGGRGQVVVYDVEGLPAAVVSVLGQIAQNGWGAGVMFEQNVPETVHLEVQVVRDRYGNVRHFGMRDCSEQRASQKIQEEAPPALLRGNPDLVERCCEIATGIADAVGYVGACTVELMYKDGHVYLLEMNTRIQVEHPVTEEAHRVRVGGELRPLDLVALQLRVAAGEPILFAQKDVVETHVARELRINAESFRPDIKDSRDGKRGLFLPNAGVFDEIFVPSAAEALSVLRERGVTGIEDLVVRFDCGFEAGDVLVNKDPTFGKLIVAVRATPEQHESRYELLRLASIAVLEGTRIAGRQVLPNGQVVPGSRFETNLEAHVTVLESPMMKAHARGVAEGRHVNWVIAMLRGQER